MTFATLSGIKIDLQDRISIVDEFEKHVCQTPHKIAIEHKRINLTYQELNSISNQFAHYLISLNIMRESMVAIFLDRGVECIIAMLAIMKAGAAYLPIDTANPRTRIDYILKDANVSFLFTHSKYSTQFTQVPNLIETDNLITLLTKKLPNTNPDIMSSANQPCYVIYTSGSTGNPKGACIEHHSVLNLVHPQGVIPFEPEFRIAQFNNIAFDGSIIEIWGALLNGATLVCIDPEIIKEPHLLFDFFKKSNISLLLVTPAIFNLHISYNSNFYKSINYLVVGGDKLEPNLVRIMQADGGSPQKLLQCYGPTETTCYSLIKYVWLIPESATSVPIGLPIQNTLVYILDTNLKICTTNTIGELYIGGEGLARGYLNRPELNIERFITYKNQRLYRTGDLAKLLPNGEIDFIGRNDTQVKIRGFRVELESIKNNLLRNPEISECAVVITKNPSLLVAYVVGKTKLDIPSLSEKLKLKLPDYMLPNRIIQLSALPLTPNAKVDLKLLQERKINFDDKHGSSIKTDTEKLLIDLWSNILGIAKAVIGTRESFFSLGGNSISVMKMLSLLHLKTSKSVSYQKFVEVPTIKALSAIVDGFELSSMQDELLTLAVNDSILPICIYPKKFSSDSISHHPKNILLTGANGFLGIHLLLELLAQTSAQIYCLVRPTLNESARDKFRANLIYYDLANLFDNPRIHIVEGDLEKPLLGISEHFYSLLIQSIDSIYHNGALVHHVYDYRRLYAANVGSTLELIQFATRVKNKEIHFISTIATVSTELDDKTSETTPSQYPPSNHSGYVLSKWVSEKILCSALQKGIKVKIYRPGNIIGHSQTGVCVPDKNHILLIIKGCIQLGFAPKWLGMVEMTPVDTLANAIVKISLQSNDNQAIYNLHNPNEISWQDYFQFIKQSGFKLDLVDTIKWRDIIKKINAKNAIYTVSYLDSYYSDESTQQWLYPVSNHTQNKLKQLEVVYPNDFQKLIKQQLAYLNKINFLNS